MAASVIASLVSWKPMTAITKGVPADGAPMRSNKGEHKDVCQYLQIKTGLTVQLTVTVDIYSLQFTANSLLVAE